MYHDDKAQIFFILLLFSALEIASQNGIDSIIDETIALTLSNKVVRPRSSWTTVNDGNDRVGTN